MNPELKTLKELISWEMEFDGEIDSVPVVSKLDVKVEVIKWINEMERRPTQELADMFDVDIDRHEQEFDKIIRFLKHFFGITEEELK